MYMYIRVYIYIYVKQTQTKKQIYIYIYMSKRSHANIYIYIYYIYVHIHTHIYREIYVTFIHIYIVFSHFGSSFSSNRVGLSPPTALGLPQWRQRAPLRRLPPLCAAPPSPRVGGKPRQLVRQGGCAHVAHRGGPGSLSRGSPRVPWATRNDAHREEGQGNKGSGRRRPPGTHRRHC